MGNNFSAQQGGPRGFKQQPQPARRLSPVDITMVDAQPEIPSPEDTDMRDASDEEVSSRAKSPPGTPLTRYAPLPYGAGGVRMFGGAGHVERKGKGKEGQPGPVFQLTGNRGIRGKRPKTKAGRISKKKQKPSQPFGNGGNNATKQRRLYQLFGGGGSNENPVLSPEHETNISPLDISWRTEDDSNPKYPSTGDTSSAFNDTFRYLEHASPFWRTAINPEWQDHLILETEVGLANEGDVCYRNVVLQMLFHLPVFLHWLVNNQELHVRQGQLCKHGEEGDICKPCHFLVVATHYWDSNLSHALEIGLFWKKVFQSWNKGANEGQQDVVEFWPELLRQFRAQTKSLLHSDLDTIFTIPTVNALKCKSGHCHTAYNPDQMNFLPIRFTEKSEDPTPIQTLIGSFFGKTPVEGNDCTQCATPRDLQQWLGHPPEVLLVHLNRIKFHDGRAQKIVQRVSFTENLKVSGEFLDPRLPAADRVDVNYELSSVILHRGKSTQSGHYRILVKSPAGLWTMLDDEKAPDELQIFDDIAANELIQSQAYIFAYRRLPLDPDYLDLEAMDTEEDIAAVAGLEERSDPFSTFMQKGEVQKGDTRKRSPRYTSPLPMLPGPQPQTVEPDSPKLDVAVKREIANTVKAANTAKRDPPNKVKKQTAGRGLVIRIKNLCPSDPKPELRRSTRPRNTVDYKE